jgi:hypothetical protein
MQRNCEDHADTRKEFQGCFSQNILTFTRQDFRELKFKGSTTGGGDMQIGYRKRTVVQQNDRAILRQFSPLKHFEILFVDLSKNS